MKFFKINLNYTSESWQVKKTKKINSNIRTWLVWWRDGFLSIFKLVFDFLDKGKWLSCRVKALPQVLEIGEKLVLKYKETRPATKPTRSQYSYRSKYLADQPLNGKMLSVGKFSAVTAAFGLLFFFQMKL